MGLRVQHRMPTHHLTSEVIRYRLRYIRRSKVISMLLMEAGRSRPTVPEHNPRTAQGRIHLMEPEHNRLPQGGNRLTAAVLNRQLAASGLLLRLQTCLRCQERRLQKWMDKATWYPLCRNSQSSSNPYPTSLTACRYTAPRSGWVPPTTNTIPPAELPTAMSHAGSTRARPHRVNSGGSDIYYEDVDPRFAEHPEPLPQQPQPMIPQLLHPGGTTYHDISPGSSGLQPHALTGSYEDLPGARSPAESETSNFTSVSQRGVNPNWRPGFGGEFNSLAPRKPVPQQTSMRRDVLLAGNPDFEIPGMGPPGRRARGGMRGGGMASAGRMPPASGIAGIGLGPEGPYPRAEPPAMRDVREI